MGLAFLRDRNGLSPVRQEWEEMRRRDPRSAGRLLHHLIEVDNREDPINNAALRYATRAGPDLYWYAINNEGVFYTYDGSNLVVIKVARAEDASDLQRLSLAAEERI